MHTVGSILLYPYTVAPQLRKWTKPLTTKHFCVSASLFPAAHMPLSLGTLWTFSNLYKWNHIAGTAFVWFLWLTVINIVLYSWVYCTMYTVYYNRLAHSGNKCLNIFLFAFCCYGKHCDQTQLTRLSPRPSLRELRVWSESGAEAGVAEEHCWLRLVAQLPFSHLESLAQRCPWPQGTGHFYIR